MGGKDTLWKCLLEWVFEDFLRFTFPNAEEVFDLERGFGFLDKEMAKIEPEPGKKAGVRFVDKLVKAFRKDGGEEWVLIHVEVQDKTRHIDRPHFSKRMFRYFYRCFDRYEKPIAAIAIFCGPDGRKMHDRYQYEFMGTRLQYSYNTICILDYSDEELEKSSNPFAWVVLAVKQDLLKGMDLDKRLLEGKLFIARKLIEHGMAGKKLQAVLLFLQNYVQFESKEMSRTFNDKFDLIIEKTKAMDIFKVVEEMRKEEGRKEASLEFVSRLLECKGMTLQKIAFLAGVSVREVKKVKAQLKAK